MHYSLLKRTWPVMLLTALAVAFLGDVWFGGKVLLMRDFFFGEEIVQLYAGQAMMHGHILHWYSQSQCGIPFAASPYNNAFYLPNWVYALPSVEWAMILSWTFHLALIGGACYTLARHWRLEIAPALFAAISITFCTFCTAWMEFSHGFFCIGWGILGMFLVSRLIDRTADDFRENPKSKIIVRLKPLFLQNAACIAALAGVLAMQVFSSGEFFYYCSLLVAGYGVARWAWHGSWKACGVSMLWIGMAGGLALCLAIPQLLSTFELMSLSTRSGEVDPAAFMTSAQPRHWLTLLLPYLYGRPGYPDTYWATTIFEFASGTFYIGILPLMAVFFCWGSKKAMDPAARERRFLVWFLSAVVGVGLVMAAGQYTPVYGFLHHWLLGLGHLRFPIKFFFYVVFALSMLGAVGFQTLLAAHDRGEESRRIRRWWIMAGMFGVFLLGYFVCLLGNDFTLWLMAHPKAPTADQVFSVITDYTWAVVFSALGLGLFGLLAFRPASARWVQGGIVAVAFLNLWVISRQVHPTGPAGIYAKLPEALGKRIGGDPMYRSYSNYWNVQQWTYGDKRPEIWEWAANVAATNHAQRLGVAILTPGGLTLSRYATFLNTVMSSPPALSGKLADMLSMRYVIGGAPFEQILWGKAPRDISVGMRPDCLPRAFVVDHWRSVSGEPSVMQTISAPSFNPHQEAIVEPLERETAPPCATPLTSNKPAGTVRALVDQGAFVSMEVEAKDRALLVLGDTFYPGWTATVDGVKRSIFQTNYLFRGVFLEPGIHRVEFSYTPTHFALGLWIWVFGAATCGVLACLSWRLKTPGRARSAKAVRGGERAEFDAFAPGYNAGMEDPLKRLIGPSADIFLEYKARWLMDFLKKQVPQRQSPWEFLDFGCGTGGFLRSMQSLGFNAAFQGCDISCKMLEEAVRTWSRSQPVPRLHHTESGQWPFAPASFDVVSACCVYHHIPPVERLETMRALFRAIKPGGWLVVFEHNPWNPVTRWMVSRCPIDENAVLLSASECAGLVKEAGFENVQQAFLLFLPPRFRRLWKYERHLEKLPMGGQYAIVAQKGGI